MSYCEKCGKEIKGNAAFCVYCGHKAGTQKNASPEKVKEALSASASALGEAAREAVSYAKVKGGDISEAGKRVIQEKKAEREKINAQNQDVMGTVSHPDNTETAAESQEQLSDQLLRNDKQRNNERNMKNVSELFVEKDEKQIAVLGAGYLSNLLSGGGLSKGFGILTNKRYYFSGKCFTKSGNHFIKTDEEWTVDLQDVTASGFCHINHVSLLILSIFSFLAGFITSMYASNPYPYHSGNNGKFLVLGLIIGGVFLALYFLTKRSMYLVTFAGGSIGVKTSFYGGIKVTKEFDRQLRSAKDKVKQVG